MKNNKKGFTLIEILVALFVGSVMMMAVYGAVNMAQKSSSGVERRVLAQQDARSALEVMAMEIGMASYNPTLNSPFKTMWVNENCTGAGTQVYRGIQAANANSITIEMDITNNAGTVTNGDGFISGPNEVITYNYAGNIYITRQTGCPVGGAQPFLGAPAAAAEQSKTVLVVNNVAGPGNSPIPVFRYYDGAGLEIPSPVTDRIPEIRRIEITLVVDAQYINPMSGQRSRVVYSTSVIPRNHMNTFTY